MSSILTVLKILNSIPVVDMRKLGFREANSLARRHPAKSRQTWDLSPEHPGAARATEEGEGWSARLQSQLAWGQRDQVGEQGASSGPRGGAGAVRVDGQRGSTHFSSTSLYRLCLESGASSLSVTTGMGAPPVGRIEGLAPT